MISQVFWGEKKLGYVGEIKTIESEQIRVFSIIYHHIKIFWWLGEKFPTPFQLWVHTIIFFPEYLLKSFMRILLIYGCNSLAAKQYAETAQSFAFSV
jgi:uncharacterized protein (DUF983 family)